MDLSVIDLGQYSFGRPTKLQQIPTLEKME